MADVRVRDVLGAILDGCNGLLELRAKSSAGKVRPTFVEPTDVGAIKSFVTAHRDDDVWFGVASRRDASSGALANCSHLGALYVDLDCHGDVPQVAAAEARLAAFALPPSIIIRSGGGLHVYWLLREPADVQAEQGAIYAFLRRLALALDGDRTAAEPARVLRLPGTFNQKYTPKRAVTIHTFEASRRYNLSDFDPILPSEPVTVSTSPADALDLSAIPAGTRNATLYKLGRSLRAKQLPMVAIVEALRATNATYRPPIETRELDAIVRQVTTQPDRSDFVPDVEIEATAPAGTRRAVLTRMADIEPKEVDWLWRQRKARGLLNLTVGDPGLGKTFLMLDTSARISRGASWPDGGRAPLGDVILLSAEDHAAFTLRPRLDVLGADLTRIHILSAIRTNENAATDCTFSLASDLALLEHAIDDTGAIAVFIDPVNSYFGTKHDAYKDTHVRAILAPLSALAERRNVCIDGTMHLTKATDRRALYRVLGGVGFVASARMALAVAQHPEDETARVLLPLKQNICAPAETLAFRLTDGRLTWDKEPVIGLTADAVLGASVTWRACWSVAEEWLRQVLEGGKVAVTIVKAEAKAAGLSWRTVERAKARVGVDSVRIGGLGAAGNGSGSDL